MARFCAGLSATCAADAPGASSAPTVWAVTSGTMAKHASKAAMTGVEKTVRPLMLLRAGVSELSQKDNSTAPCVVPCENDFKTTQV
jgi:hypothetical protein